MNPIASSIVATGILAAIAGITIAAIIRYPIDDALKIWSALSALVGVVTGSFVTYFFTRQAAQQATQRAQENAQTAQAAVRQNSVTSEALQQAQERAFTAQQGLTTLVHALEPAMLDQLKATHPGIKAAVDP